MEATVPEWLDESTPLDILTSPRQDVVMQRVPARSLPPSAIRVALVTALLALSALLSGCTAIESRIDGFELDVDVDQILDEVRDCERLAARFTGVIRTAAEALDEYSAANEGRVPATDITTAVDRIAASKFTDIAEQLGCARLQFQLDMIDRLQQLDPESDAGAELIKQIEDQLGG
jgi:hypothetical protein